ncbi:MAG: hypothetical protein LBJ00_09395 [Planctomycetaceae bacterium]|jgi:hypothetical protein|nr:hypothetical protein [Planctomycetaceae bacterium]
MKKATLIVAVALLSATFIVPPQSVTADELNGAIDPKTGAGTPVAGITKQENPQPKTRALLHENAKREIRWQPWEYRNAFSASVLEQIQKSINEGKIKLGEVNISENDTLFDAVEKGSDLRIPALVEAYNSRKLDLSKGKNFKLAVYTYRHNYADTGLFQLYVSGTVTFDTTEKDPPEQGKEHPFMDIQALQYEFEDPDYTSGKPGKSRHASQTVTLWRGAVVRVNAEGTVENVAGSIAGVNVGAFDKDGKWIKAEVNQDPFADWELASVLKRDAYDPAMAVDRPDYVHPSDRIKKIEKVANEAGLGVQPGIQPVPKVYQYTGPRSSYRYTRFLLGNGR